MGPLFWVGPMRTALGRGGRLRAGWEPAYREKEECHGTSFRVGPTRTALWLRGSVDTSLDGVSDTHTLTGLGRALD